MFDVQVDASEPLQLFRRLEDPDLLDPLFQEGGETFVEFMQQYPPERHAKQEFVSDKQRRGFFYYLRKGLIEVPYRRGQSPGSENLKRRWIVRKAAALRWIAANTASYAALVHGITKRTRYHQLTGWLTIPEAWQQVGGRIKRKWGAGIRGILRKG